MLSMPDNGSIFIFRDGNAMSEFFKLVDAKINDMNLIAPLLSRIVPSGTKVVVTDGGFATSTVLVVDGPQSSCKGDVPNERLR
jgi:hypothetical protein